MQRSLDCAMSSKDSCLNPEALAQVRHGYSIIEAERHSTASQLLVVNTSVTVCTLYDIYCQQPNALSFITVHKPVV